MTATENLAALYREKIGSEVHVGAWLTIDQERIDVFAQVSGDRQWIHTDPGRAVVESPYGATVAHGFLTLSLFPLLTESNAPGMFERNYPGMRLRVNYGLDRVRFPAPVVTGSRIRARTVVIGVDEIAGGVQIAYRITVEIEGGGETGLRSGAAVSALSVTLYASGGYRFRSCGGPVSAILSSFRYSR